MPTVAELRKELKSRGLDTTGKKAELEARLAQSDSAQTDAQEPVEETVEEPPKETAKEKKAAAAAAAKKKKAAEAAEKKAAKEAQAAEKKKAAEEKEAAAAAAKAEAEAAKAAEAEEAAEREAQEKQAAEEAAARVAKAAEQKAAAAAAAAAKAAEAQSGKAAQAESARRPAPAAAAAAPGRVGPIASGFGFDDVEEPPPAQTQAESKAAKLEARRIKLAELREQMNKARGANVQSVREETRAAVTGGNEQKRKHAEWVKIKRDNEESAAARGEDLSKPEMYESAEQAEQRAKKQKKKEKNKASFGWEVFNQDNLFRAYKKRADGAFGGTESEKADYSALKHSYAATGGNFYPSANDMDYGAQSEAGSLAQAIPEANIARMVNELDDAAARRKNFSRRRAHNDDRDVDSINERNAVFNRKVGRAFDKYTVEIRQNLERGTALPN